MSGARTEVRWWWWLAPALLASAAATVAAVERNWLESGFWLLWALIAAWSAGFGYGLGNNPRRES